MQNANMYVRTFLSCFMVLFSIITPANKWIDYQLMENIDKWLGGLEIIWSNAKEPIGYLDSKCINKK